MGCKNPEMQRIYSLRHNRKFRRRALECISDGVIECVRCHCAILKFLEINHINGGGGKHFKSLGERGIHGGHQFHKLIINGILDKKEFNILCRVCNALDHLERKYGPTGHNIIWKDLGPLYH